MSQAEQDYLLELESIEQMLTQDDVVALDLGNGVCSRAADGWDQDKLRAWVLLFVSDDAVPPIALSEQQANAVIAAADRYLCP